MKLVNASIGGTKIVFEKGDDAVYRNPFAPMHANAIKVISFNPEKNEVEGNPIAFDSVAYDGLIFEIKHVIPANVHKPHDLYRYIIENIDEKGQVQDYLISQTYLSTRG